MPGSVLHEGEGPPSVLPPLSGFVVDVSPPVALSPVGELESSPVIVESVSVPESFKGGGVELLLLLEQA